MLRRGPEQQDEIADGQSQANQPVEDGDHHHSDRRRAVETGRTCAGEELRSDQHYRDNECRHHRLRDNRGQQELVALAAQEVDPTDEETGDGGDERQAQEP